METAKKQTVHCYMRSRDLAVTDFLAVDLELVQTTRNVEMEHEIPFGNSIRENVPTFLDFPPFGGGIFH